jgi:hypothetical protein
MRNSIITGIILIILSGIAAEFFFNDKIELRYVVSDRIPTNFFKGEESESIQQLELLNTGDIELQRIIIKINANVLEYTIQKVTNSDSIIISKTLGDLEILYPQLPPESTIKIIIKSLGDGIDIDDIDIKHSKGRAKLALEANSSFNYISSATMVFYLIIISIGIRTTLFDSVRSRVFYNPYDKILKKTKPWYLPLGKWESLREDSLKHVFDNNNSSNFQNNLYFQILNSEKSQNITNEEWGKLQENAQKKLTEAILENLINGLNWNFEKFLSFKKPKNIDDENWNKIKLLISKYFTMSLIMKVRDYNSQDEISQLLKRQKPEIIDENEWKNYIKFLKRFVEIENKKIKNDLLEKELLNVIYRIGLKEKPEILESEIWEMLKKIDNQIIKYSEKVEKDLIELKRVKLETIPLKEKLDKQLKIIHEVLNDPLSIDRIEDYANPFSKGNFENLKLIAEITKNSKSN